MQNLLRARANRRERRYQHCRMQVKMRLQTSGSKFFPLHRMTTECLTQKVSEQTMPPGHCGARQLLMFKGAAPEMIDVKKDSVREGWAVERSSQGVLTCAHVDSNNRETL